LKSLVEQLIKTGQLFLGSKFAGVANIATALGGKGPPPCTAYDFACALGGTFALTVEPGEKLAAAKLTTWGCVRCYHCDDVQRDD
jgi:hypothetical protein